MNFNQEMVILSDRDQTKLTKRSSPAKKPTFAIEEAVVKKGKKPKGGTAVTSETERLRKVVKEKASRSQTTKKVNQGINARTLPSKEKQKGLGSKRDSIKQVEDIRGRYECYNDLDESVQKPDESSELRKIRDSSRGRVAKTASAAPAESARSAKKQASMNKSKM